MKTTGLAALISPRSLSEFLPHLSSHEPLVVKGLTTTIRPLTQLPLLKSLDALFKLWPAQVQGHLPGIADEANSVDVSPLEARKLFKKGTGLMFEHAQKNSPKLEQWLEAIRKDLGLSALTESRCLLYATPKDTGTAPHFDQNVNFVLQLHGRKNWWLAPNQHVENPLTRHTIGLPTDPELQTYAEKPMPKRMPSGVRPVTLEPGTLLFVPRGTWHWTKAESDALSLNFTYSAPTWLDLFTAALRSRLALSHEWRETANGVSSRNRDHKDAARQRFDMLLQELTLDLPNWTAMDILGATEGR